MLHVGRQESWRVSRSRAPDLTDRANELGIGDRGPGWASDRTGLRPPVLVTEVVVDHLFQVTVQDGGQDYLLSPALSSRARAWRQRLEIFRTVAAG